MRNEIFAFSRRSENTIASLRECKKNTPPSEKEKSWNFSFFFCRWILFARAKNIAEEKKKGIIWKGNEIKVEMRERKFSVES